MNHLVGHVIHTNGLLPQLQQQQQQQQQQLQLQQQLQQQQQKIPPSLGPVSVYYPQPQPQPQHQRMRWLVHPSLITPSELFKLDQLLRSAAGRVSSWSDTLHAACSWLLSRVSGLRVGDRVFREDDWFGVWPLPPSMSLCTTHLLLAMRIHANKEKEKGKEKERAFLIPPAPQLQLLEAVHAVLSPEASLMLYEWTQRLGTESSTFHWAPVEWKEEDEAWVWAADSLDSRLADAHASQRWYQFLWDTCAGGDDRSGLLCSDCMPEPGTHDSKEEIWPAAARSQWLTMIKSLLPSLRPHATQVQRAWMTVYAFQVHMTTHAPLESTYPYLPLTLPYDGTNQPTMYMCCYTSHLVRMQFAEEQKMMASALPSIEHEAEGQGHVDQEEGEQEGVVSTPFSGSGSSSSSSSHLLPTAATANSEAASDASDQPNPLAQASQQQQMEVQQQQQDQQQQKIEQPMEQVHQALSSWLWSEELFPVLTATKIK
jgi:hypothetical protein